jgi:hypothetical protein
MFALVMAAMVAAMVVVVELGLGLIINTFLPRIRVNYKYFFT